MSLSTCDANSCFDGVDLGTLGGSILAFNTFGVQLQGLDGATVTERFLDAQTPASRTGVEWRSAWQSVTIDQRDGRVLSLQAQGGLELHAPDQPGQWRGGRLALRDLTFDLAQGVVVASVSGTAWTSPSNAHQSFDVGRVPVMTFSLTAPAPAWADTRQSDNLPAVLAQGGYRVIDIQSRGGLGHYTYGLTFGLSNLALSSEGMRILSATLSSDRSLGAMLPAGDFAVPSVLTAQVVAVGLPVPEPEGWALALCGLAGLFVKVVRQRAPWSLRAAPLDAVSPC
ncbi:hypothetical protein EYS42_12295 [Aquabacterium lacunae]|uniref:Uncharacterized protein n=1 Tax=Aquabacterium lacunae TaxID=2528630 RepID=A0A4Q9H1C6_9BURK|nr:hypothetical protein [Aquabacterium lacunae]TBO29186.1 hypothetical protein EYS42_12295 [Aquabacterium lacunae]